MTIQLVTTGKKQNTYHLLTRKFALVTNKGRKESHLRIVVPTTL